MMPTFEAHAARQMDGACADLTYAWAQSIVHDLPSGQRRDPSLYLAGQVPDVLRRAAAFVRTGEEGMLAADADVVDSLTLLARLRYRDGTTPADLLREFDLLARLLDAACLQWLAEFDPAPPGDAVVRVAGRLNRVPLQMAEISMRAYRDEEVRELQQDPEALHEFAELIAHELANPLNAAAMNAQILESLDAGAASEDVRRLAMLMRRNLRRVDAVLRDVQTAAVRQPGAPSELVPFGSVLADVMTEVHDELTDAEVRLQLDEPIPGIPVDGARVKIVLVNLIRNAVKYADPESRDRCVRLSFEHVPGECAWWVSVSDNGMGIPEDIQPSVFERFFRGHRGQARGRGIGLAIVRDQVEQLGGRIMLTSKPGKGTTFRFSLPDAATDNLLTTQ